MFLKKNTFLIILAHHLHIPRGTAGCRARDVDPPPPSRRAGFQGVSNLHSDFCRLLTSDGPRTIRRPHPQIPVGAPVADPRTPNVGLLADFLPNENLSKIRPLEKRPKTSKVGSLIAQTSILGSLLASILARIFHEFLDFFIIC